MKRSFLKSNPSIDLSEADGGSYGYAPGSRRTFPTFSRKPLKRSRQCHRPSRKSPRPSANTTSPKGSGVALGGGYSAAPLPVKAKVNRPAPEGRGGPGLDWNRAAEFFVVKGKRHKSRLTPGSCHLGRTVLSTAGVPILQAPTQKCVPPWDTFCRETYLNLRFVF